MGNTFLQVAIKGLLFILSKMNSQLEHLAVTGLCVVLFSRIFHRKQNKVLKKLFHTLPFSFQKE